MATLNYAKLLRLIEDLGELIADSPLLDAGDTLLLRQASEKMELVLDTQAADDFGFPEEDES